MKEKKIPKKAAHMLENLEFLTDQFDYFSPNSEYFRKEILPRVRELEDFIKTRAVNQKKTFREIASRYEKLYEEKLEKKDLPD